MKKDTCQRHKKEVAGVSDMKLLAEMVGDLHYESLVEFVKELIEKLHNDGRKDFVGGKPELASALFMASVHLNDALVEVVKAAKISKPFMKKY